MEKVKSFVAKNFEKIIAFSILFAIISINYFVFYKFLFLNFFYLPIIASGYYLGKKMAVLTALLSIGAVSFFVILDPKAFFIADINNTYIILNLVGWGAFIILAGVSLGYLYEQKEKHIKELKAAYIGILEIMSKYLESSDKYTKGHSVRVAHLSESLASLMELSRSEVENITAAALLHDIGKTEVSLDILNKAAKLSSSEIEIMAAHSEKGANILSLTGAVLNKAVPIVLAHHNYYFDTNKYSSKEKNEIPIGTAIVAVADAFDAMISDRPYRAGSPPWKAYQEIEANSGKQFHPEVVNTLKKVLISDENYGIEEKKEVVNSLKPT
ncbi:HD domain-containing phosphohydrolase [Acidobacteriota bacterium]